MRKIRYAVVGLGHIAQTAVLPAFKNAKNSELVALVSSDPVKLKKLGKKYKVPHLFSYEEFDLCLNSNIIDAVYIALPNTLHKNFTVKAAENNIHVLCEKPMAIDEEDCLSMIQTAREHDVKLMIAYRLHFDKANMKAVQTAQSQKLGDIRIFNSTFTYQIKDLDNIRLKSELGGGPLFDIGIYCINAARYLFQGEPLEVFAMSSHYQQNNSHKNSKEKRFSEVPEMVTATLRFSEDRFANFVCSFGSSDSSSYTLIGTKGSLSLEGAYEYAEKMNLEICIGKRTKKESFPKHDQFAPELIYFSNCILNNKNPEPNGTEGLADVRIIQALMKSIETGSTIPVDQIGSKEKPNISQAIHRSAVQTPHPIHATAPHKS